MAEGMTGLAKGPARTGVRELTYRLCFIANGTQVGGAYCTRAGCHWRWDNGHCWRAGSVLLRGAGAAVMGR